MSGTFRGAVRQRATSTYDTTVLAESGLVAYWRMDGTGADLTGNGRTATAHGGPTLTQFLNGDPATVLNGVDQYWEVADHNDLSPATTGRFTFEAWIRPDVLTFLDTEGSGPYVHWAGKLASGQNEWVSRMYNFDTPDITPARPNRISGYAFNLSGGTGVGSHFQDAVVAGQWIHYALIVNTVDTSGTYPTGYTKIYRDGVLRDTDDLRGLGDGPGGSDLNIVPANGTAPVRFGTATLNSFFLGAICKPAIYNTELSAARLLAHKQIIVP